MNESIVIGTGQLNWERSERVTDRYGFVFLDGVEQLWVNRYHMGQRAILRARVIEVRQSSHIGDFFHGIRPSTPEIGEVITLGTGLLSIGQNSEGRPTIGLQPFDDDRPTMWLDINSLYRCHQQTVELSYQPLEERR